MTAFDRMRLVDTLPAVLGGFAAGCVVGTGLCVAYALWHKHATSETPSAGEEVEAVTRGAATSVSIGNVPIDADTPLKGLLSAHPSLRTHFFELHDDLQQVAGDRRTAHLLLQSTVGELARALSMDTDELARRIGERI